MEKNMIWGDISKKAKCCQVRKWGQSKRNVLSSNV